MDFLQFSKRRFSVDVYINFALFLIGFISEVSGS